MKLSVITPSYNAGVYLAQAVSSVRKQKTGFPLTTEIIVIDDGSTDHSVEQLQGSNLIILHQDHQGSAKARNYGIKEATGDYILFLDADDKLVPDAIETLYHGLLQNEHAVATLGMAQEFISEEIDAETAAGLPKKEIPFGAFLSGCCLVEKDALLKVGFFDASLDAGETVDWLARLRNSGLPIVELEKITAHRRIHLTNKGRIHEKIQMKEYAAIIRKRMLAQKTRSK